MVTQQFIVTCPKCNSNNVSFKEKHRILTKRCVTDFSLDHQWYVPSSMERILECHCNQCNYTFIESLGIEYIPLIPGEIET